MAANTAILTSRCLLAWDGGWGGVGHEERAGSCSALQDTHAREVLSAPGRLVAPLPASIGNLDLQPLICTDSKSPFQTELLSPQSSPVWLPNDMRLDGLKGRCVKHSVGDIILRVCCACSPNPHSSLWGGDAASSQALGDLRVAECWQ